MGIISLISKEEGRPHDQKRTTDQTGKSSTQARNRTLTPAELKADYRERICKKLSVLVDQRTKNRKPRK